MSHAPPFLGSDFGPIAQCTQISGGQARSGFFSPLTKAFDPGAWASIVENRVVKVNSCPGTDGASGTCVGYPVVNTTFGGGSRVTQYQSTRARVGWYNVVTRQFYPDTANGGWYPL